MVDCKLWIKRGLVGSRFLALAQRLKQPRTIILRYHSVQDEPRDHANSLGTGIIHSTAAFKEQMEWLARHYQPVTLDDIAPGDRSVPRNSVAITFDDGYADNFEIALPILNRLGLRAAFYITVDCVALQKAPWFCRLRHAFAQTSQETWTDPEKARWLLTDPALRRQAFLAASAACGRQAGDAQERVFSRIEHELAVEPLAPERPLMMNWEQVRTLHQHGHIVGSHTLTHPNLAQVGPDDVSRELCESKQRLEERLRSPVVHFSYPSPILQPHWTEETVACCREHGYRTAVTCTTGAVFKTDPLLSLKRISAPEKLDDFKWAVQCAFLGRYV